MTSFALRILGVSLLRSTVTLVVMIVSEEVVKAVLNSGTVRDALAASLL